jgi:hypothetical protein
VGFADVAQGLPSGPRQQVVAVGTGEGISIGGRFVEVVRGGEEQIKFAGAVGGVVEVDEEPSVGGGVVEQIFGV